tara:strand:+ start:7215 stop:9263 length:2049 start_codon:yes stop_codon:yes gene_type:complete
MPTYGWAYVNLDVLESIQGPAGVTGTLAIVKDSTTLSGSKFVAYATASNKLGIGLNFPTVLPSTQLHVSASAGENIAITVEGDLSASSNISGSYFYGDGTYITNVGGAGGEITVGANVNTGAANRVVYENASNKIAESANLTFDGTTLQPTAISASVNVSASAFYGDGANITFTNATIQASSLSASVDLQVGGDTTGSATVYVSRTTNRVGINKSTPGGDLHVVSDGSDALFIKAGGVTVGSSDDPNAQLYVNAENDNMFQVRHDGGGGTECLFVSGSGFVGIGTLTPAQALTVVGDVSASVHVSASAFYGDGANLTNVGGGVTVGNAVGSGTGNRILYEDSSNNLAESSNLQFDGSILAVTGTVGIGVGAPAATLHISSSISAMVKPMFQVDCPGSGSASGEQQDALFVVTGSVPSGEDFFEGMVAINKSTAARTFHVVSKQSDAFVVDQGKVVVGSHTPSNGLLSVKNPSNKLFEVTWEDGESNPWQVFYASGSALDNFNYGSDLTGSVFINSGSAYFGNVTTAATLSASVGVSGTIGEFGTLTVGSTAIEGGTVNNTVIGGATAAAATVTTLTQTSGLVKYRSKASGDSPYGVAASDYIIGVNTTGGAVEVDLQAASSAGTGRMLVIKDVGGAAATNNITIDPNGSEKIDGQTSLVIAANSGSAMLFCDGSNWFIAGTR